MQEPKPSALAAPTELSQVGALVAQLAHLEPFDIDQTQGPWPRRFRLWATRCNWLGLSLLMVFALLASIRYGAGLVAGSMDWLLLALGLSLPILGIISLLCTVASEAWHVVEMHRHAGRHMSMGYEHDRAHALQLLAYPLPTLAAADNWLAQRVKRIERRQMRVFGGNDKLALLTLVAAGWTSWKELQALQNGLEPSWLIYGLAFVGGLALGGLLLGAMLERLGYQRDLLALAIDQASERQSSAS